MTWNIILFDHIVRFNGGYIIWWKTHQLIDIAISYLDWSSYWARDSLSISGNCNFFLYCKQNHTVSDEMLECCWFYVSVVCAAFCCRNIAIFAQFILQWTGRSPSSIIQCSTHRSLTSETIDVDANACWQIHYHSRYLVIEASQEVIGPPVINGWNIE